jgi:hypothetical protein
MARANGNNRHRRAGFEARSRQPDGEASPVGKPFHRVANPGGVDRAGSNAREGDPSTETRRRIGVGVHHSADADQASSGGDHQTGGRCAAQAVAARAGRG